MALLEIKNLQIEFEVGGVVRRAVDRLSLSVEPGETVCLVGESGCGKSVTALSIARLLPSPPARYSGGQIWLNGREVLCMARGQLRKIRGAVVSYVFQNPAASLHPAFRIGSQIKESLRLHRPREASEFEVVRLLKWVGIPAPELRRNDYPHQLSGGLQQRAMIALALASRPKLLVADEPTTALDVTIQAQILELLHTLKGTLGMSILLITHNLGIVGGMADRVAVMYAGRIVESAPALDLLRRPLHPYSRALIQSVPRLGNHEQRLVAIPGQVPSLDAMPAGCRFHPRCSQVQPDCAGKAPVLIEVETQHWVRCPYWALRPATGEPKDAK
ncbi:MAG: ABC transporter ATP-binding protein [Candidatus Omnitrophica bacterium]|nr:ABC transporter ATP-binding protein [Candidatus Omnitrophota bacterium]